MNFAQCPVREPGRDLPDVVGEPVAEQHEHEPGDDDTQDRDADERCGGECRRALTGDRQQKDRDDGETQIEQLVPEAGEGQSTRDVARGETPATQDPVRPRQSGCGPSGNDYGQCG